mmetsp:Transcript_55833/g.167340  ORF Transcript_55833/g.167340 Transcript_55833/m.167340 type:complete len:150 (+) Transcript_55833:3151-3600(+)
MGPPHPRQDDVRPESRKTTTGARIEGPQGWRTQRRTLPPSAEFLAKRKPVNDPERSSHRGAPNERERYDSDSEENEVHLADGRDPEDAGELDFSVRAWSARSNGLHLSTHGSATNLVNKQGHKALPEIAAATPWRNRTQYIRRNRLPCR